MEMVALWGAHVFLEGWLQLVFILCSDLSKPSTGLEGGWIVGIFFGGALYRLEAGCFEV